MMPHMSQLTSWSESKSTSLSQTLHLSPAQRTCAHVIMWSSRMFRAYIST